MGLGYGRIVEVACKDYRNGAPFLRNGCAVLAEYAMIADNEEIEFVYVKVKRKPALQQLHEELEQCEKRLMEYKECFEIMGKNRNSYSKT